MYAVLRIGIRRGLCGQRRGTQRGNARRGIFFPSPHTRIGIDSGRRHPYARQLHKIRHVSYHGGIVVFGKQLLQIRSCLLLAGLFPRWKFIFRLQKLLGIKKQDISSCHRVGFCWELQIRIEGTTQMHFPGERLLRRPHCRKSHNRPAYKTTGAICDTVETAYPVLVR